MSSLYNDYTGSYTQTKSACAYGSLSNYNSNAKMASCSKRYIIVPTFGGAPGYNNLTNTSSYNMNAYNSGGCDYTSSTCSYKTAYSNCNCSNYIAKLCQ
jgi:hypothetical protein